MVRSLAWLVVLLLCLGTLVAQDRRASVQLDDGRVLAGRVVAMDLATLRLDVAGEVVVLSTDKIRSCRFQPTEAASEPAAGGTEAAAAPSAGDVPAETAGVEPESQAPTPRSITGPVDTGLAADTDEKALPLDVRNRSRLRIRLEALDERYPWLAPTAPSQWISLGLLLFVCTSLIVHLSVRVVGAEAPSLPLSMVVAAWYLLSTLLQVALVPTADISTAAMLLCNPAVALFLATSLFGLSRPAAVLAFAIQLGFLGVGFGLLELVDSLLKSVGNPQL